MIHKAEEQEQLVDNARAESLEVLFKLANDGHVKLGDLSAIEGIIEYFEDISDKQLNLIQLLLIGYYLIKRGLF